MDSRPRRRGFQYRLGRLEEHSWVSRSAILDKDMLREFHHQHPGKPGGSLEVPVEGGYYHGPGWPRKVTCVFVLIFLSLYLSLHLLSAPLCLGGAHSGLLPLAHAPATNHSPVAHHHVSQPLLKAVVQSVLSLNYCLTCQYNPRICRISEFRSFFLVMIYPVSYT